MDKATRRIGHIAGHLAGPSSGASGSGPSTSSSSYASIDGRPNSYARVHGEQVLSRSGHPTAPPMTRQGARSSPISDLRQGRSAAPPPVGSASPS